MRIYLFDSFEQASSGYIDVPPTTFLDLISNKDEIPSLFCEDEKAKLEGPGFVVAEYIDNAPSRKSKYLTPNSSVQVLTFDIDSMSKEEVEKAYSLWQEYDTAIYSTWKHTTNKPRLRLMLALDKPIENTDKEAYKRHYESIAESLKIGYDKNACDTVRFYFGPQHRDQPVVRERYKGVPFPVGETTVAAAVPKKDMVSREDDFLVTSDRPDRQEVSRLSKKLRAMRSTPGLKLATALDAILRGEKFAPEGSRHSTTLRVSMELVREWPQLDSAWFAKEYLEANSWPEMWGDSWSASAPKDWENAVSGAKKKIEEAKIAREGAAKVVGAVKGKDNALSEEQYDRAKAHAGRLILSVRTGYYVYSPVDDEYKGAFKAAELPVAVRDYLRALEGVEERRRTKNGGVLKTATELCYEYGTTGEEIVWLAKKPPQNWCEETRTIYRQAYKWIEWEPVRHKIADDLLFAMFGPKLSKVLAYFTKFRDLEIPLPALTLVGAAGVWKSRLCEIIGRFWSDKYVTHANKADIALGRFNDCLLSNPVIWSDECLAKDRSGRPQPERYRESITSRVQHIEPKGLQTERFFSCVRHVITANNDTKVFPSEVDADSIAATMNRFLLLYIDEAKVREFERKWDKTEELDILREGSSLLEHIRWIEKNFKYESEGRLFVHPKIERSVLLRSRFQDDLLNFVWSVAFEALENETRMSVKGQINRLPLVVDGEGVLRLSPKRITSLWSTSRELMGSGVRKPTAQHVGNLLNKAGFKKHEKERLDRAPFAAWEVNVETLREFLEIAESVSWDELKSYCLNVFGREPKEK